MENKIPPPLIAISAALLMFSATIIFPTLMIAIPFGNIIGAILFIVSAFVMGAGVWEFRQRSTTINPLKPETASSLVNTGIFQYTRNPMYLGMAGILVGLFFYWGNFVSALIIPVFLLYIYQFQIKPEERAMIKLFSSEFEDYCKQVRPWI
ncbi:MAG: isoprenylcysteine carboxylmethyltransferase family protein [Pseudomonadales bacterium]|nr:isoprenylcysteine carboxylmethyltransferase family protein [Pseudomonadales bacterium]